jgi:RNase P/RNase MRP subunit POP5
MRSSLRDNFRYILIRDETNDEKNELTQTRVAQVLDKFLGVFGVYETGAKIISAQDTNVIVRVFRGCEDKVCTCFALVNNESGKNIRLRVLRISGTIDALCSKQKLEKPQKRSKIQKK